MKASSLSASSWVRMRVVPSAGMPLASKRVTHSETSAWEGALRGGHTLTESRTRPWGPLASCIICSMSAVSMEGGRLP